MSKKTIVVAIVLALVALAMGPGMTVSTVEANGTSTNWAIVIAGGANVDNNHARYWNDLSEMYEILTVNYGYAAADVFVLYADGSPPTAANCHDSGNAHASYPTGIIDYAATAANLDTVTDLIAASGHPCDTLFVFTTDHGGAGGTLNLWGETISAATFASYMDDITQFNWRAFEMEQCYSGEMIPDLSDPNTAIATAAGSTTSCGAGASLFYYDPFAYYFNAALKGEFPSPAGGGTVDPSSWSTSDVTAADADSDGKVSFVEAYNYAYPLSTCDEDEQYDDNGDGVSQTTGPMPAGGDGALGSLIFLGEKLNDPPTANAGPDQTVEQDYYQGEDVTLDGSGSTDDGCMDLLTYSWTWTGGSATGVSPTVALPLGVTTIELEVYDGEYTDSDTVDITVGDTTSPDVDAGDDVTVEQTSLAGAPAVLPIPVVEDICDPDPMVVIDGVMATYPLGDTTVTVTATDASGNTASDTVVVHVVDTTAPVVACLETVNPHGKKVPPAQSSDGKNRDGFYELSAEDICDPAPEIYVVDTGSGMVHGPFGSDIKIKYTVDPDAMPEIKKIGSDKGKAKAGAIDWHIIGNGDALAVAVDFSSNWGQMTCD